MSLRERTAARFVEAGGHRLEYERIDAATADSPTLVLLHEGLGSIALWRDFPRQLAAATGCCVIVYSRYGYGRSDPLAEPRLPSYMHDEAQQALPDLLRALAIVQPILVGHSDGASIALIAAGTRAVDPRGLVVIAPHVFVEERSIAGIAAARVAYHTGELRRRLSPWHDDVDSAFRGWNDIWLDPRFRDWNVETILDGIRCPILAIQGEDDEYGTTAQIDAITRRVVRVETLLLPGCGHVPHRDAPDEVLAAIARFVERTAA